MRTAEQETRDRGLGGLCSDVDLYSLTDSGEDLGPVVRSRRKESGQIEAFSAGGDSSIHFQNKLDGYLADGFIGILLHRGAVELKQGNVLPGEVLHHQLYCVRTFIATVCGAEQQRTRRRDVKDRGRCARVAL